MTERIAIVTRERLPWRPLALAGLAAVLLFAVLRVAPLTGDGASTGVPSAGAVAVSHDSLSGLSLAARASISAALGADDSAYHFEAAPDGFQAANAAQHLGIRADRAGVSVRGRHLELGLSLQAIGYGNSLHAVRALAPGREANRVTYAYRGVSEWYVNGPLGLEQGFTVTRSPGRGATGPLTLAISLSGNARASVLPGADGVDFTAARGGSLRYAGLSVTDAGGRALRSSLAVRGGQLLLRVDARGARFPLRIDPNLEEVAERRLTPKEGEETQRSGVSVALSADASTALVGAPGGVGSAGAVWVFTRTVGPEGPIYEQTEQLTAGTAGEPTSCGEHQGDEGADECSFGSSVALSANGDTALVGAPAADGHLGAAFIFTHSGSSWQSTELTSPQANSAEAGSGGLFGRSVALSANGETALIGAPGERRGHGQAWVFEGSGATWTQGELLTASGEEAEAHFGKSVALSGNGEVALIAAPDEEEHLGAAWVFERSGAQAFQQGPKLTGAGANPGARFGSSVALSNEGNTALVGAPDQAGAKGEEDAGAVWAFARSASGADAASEWVEQGPRLTGPGEEHELFGYSVALSPEGGLAVVGAPRWSTGVGEAWEYERSGTNWSAPPKRLVSQEENDKARFGRSVAMSAGGAVMLIGAPGNGGREGAAWVFGRGPAVTSVSPAAGPRAGGTTVTIEGQHFTPDATVHFEKTEAESVKVESENLITAVSPPGAGTVHIAVTTPFGTSDETSAAEFTYEGPQVTSVEPRSGTTKGGTHVTLQGKYLTGALAVRFGAVAASFKVESPGLITAVSPPGADTVYITVVTPFGESVETAADRFTYVEASEPAGKREEPEKPSNTGTSGGNGTSGENGTSGGNGTGGTNLTGLGVGQVLALGPVNAGTCGASLLSKKILVAHSKLVLFKLVGTGAGGCRGKLRLRVRVTLGHKHFVLKTIGTANFSIAAGKRVAVKVTLTSAGRALLRADHGLLNASLLIVKSVPLPSHAQVASVHLAPQPPAKHAAKPKT